MPRKDVDQDPQHVPSQQQSPLMLQSENVMQLNHTDLNQVWGGEPTDSQTSNADPRRGAAGFVAKLPSITSQQVHR